MNPPFDYFQMTAKNKKGGLQTAPQIQIIKKSRIFIKLVPEVIKPHFPLAAPFV
jgi:hypothetical protein